MLTPEGMVDPARADEEWAANSVGKGGHRQGRAALEAAINSPLPVVGGLVEGNGHLGVASLTSLRAQHEQLRLELTATELEERRGNLVARGEVERTLREEGRRVRDAVLKVPNQVAAQLAACGDPQGCRLMMHEALRRAFRECAKGGEDDLGGQEPDTGDGRG